MKNSKCLHLLLQILWNIQLRTFCKLSGFSRKWLTQGTTLFSILWKPFQFYSLFFSYFDKSIPWLISFLQTVQVPLLVLEQEDWEGRGTFRHEPGDFCPESADHEQVVMTLANLVCPIAGRTKVSKLPMAQCSAWLSHLQLGSGIV